LFDKGDLNESFGNKAVSFFLSLDSSVTENEEIFGNVIVSNFGVQVSCIYLGKDW
jgi:hypothetical protein